jgi:hypothetical protein
MDVDDDENYISNDNGMESDDESSTMGNFSYDGFVSDGEEEERARAHSHMVNWSSSSSSSSSEDEDEEVEVEVEEDEEEEKMGIKIDDKYEF